MDAATTLELADWRRRVNELYASARAGGDGVSAWDAWCDGKRTLYREHPQSPVPRERRAAHAFACFDHDPTLRVLAQLEPGAPTHRDGDGDVPGMTHVGVLRFELRGASCSLGAYWLDGYAGGLFVPFADSTSGLETYGGGRYALDTAKGADLGVGAGGAVVLDFNFAYAPSCAHDPQWRCPLAPAGNRLAVPVRGGERSASPASP